MAPKLMSLTTDVIKDIMCPLVKENSNLDARIWAIKPKAITPFERTPLAKAINYHDKKVAKLSVKTHD